MLRTTLALAALMVVAAVGTVACGALIGTAEAQGPYAMVPGASGGKVAIPVSSMVYVTAHGKTYHMARNCMALAKSSGVLQTTAKLAEEHGLKLCAICAHRGAVASSGRKTFDNSWATFGGAK